MSRNNPFTLRFGDLPRTLPIFPLPKVAVLPDTRLPLNIFEPRYLRMVFDVLGSHRMIGMVQPKPGSVDSRIPDVYRTGTAGRITSFSESNDGRLMIVLSGICRFEILEESDTDLSYRTVVPDWSRFAADYEADEEPISDRPALLRALRDYCDGNDVQLAWKDIEELRDRALVDLLTVHLPLEIADKQALIECIELQERTRLLHGLLEMSRGGEGDNPGMRH